MADKKLIITVSVSMVIVAVLIVIFVIVLLWYRKRLKKKNGSNIALRGHYTSTSPEDVKVSTIEIIAEKKEVTSDGMVNVTSYPVSDQIGEENPGLIMDEVEPPIRKSINRYAEIDLTAED